jgi:hypothetical protein
MNYLEQKVSEDARKAVMVERLPNIAKLLGTMVTVDMNTENRLSAVITIDGLPIHLRYDGYGAANKLEISGYFRTESDKSINDYRKYDNRNMDYGINITDKKTDVQIANDIKRRLLTVDYKEDYFHALNRYIEYEVKAAEKEVTIKAMCTLLGDTYREDSNYREQVISRKHDVTVKVHAADSMTIQLPCMSYARALEVLSLLGFDK